MSEAGRLESICVSKKKGERKTPVDTAVLVDNHGIEDDAHAGDWHRQISILCVADVEMLRAKGMPELKAGDFAENLDISGLDFSTLGLGSTISIGPDAVLSITQIGKVCHTRCAIYYQTGDCIMPTRGLFLRVLKGGTISNGDEVRITEAVTRDTIQCVVLTLSDRCSRGETEDTAGPAVAQRLRDEMGAHIYASEILPDDRPKLAERLKHYCDGHTIDFICAVGGTGFAPRDITPEAIGDVIERATPGLDEVMRSVSMAKTPNGMLSRAKSGMRGSALIVSTPGSEKAAVENIDAILPALKHGILKMRGDPSDCGRPEEDTA